MEYGHTYLHLPGNADAEGKLDDHEEDHAGSGGPRYDGEHKDCARPEGATVTTVKDPRTLVRTVGVVCLRV